MGRAFLETLDARTKFVSLILLASTIVVAKSSLSFGVVATILLGAIALSPLSPFHMLHKLKNVSWFVVFIIGIQTFTTSGQVLFSLAGFYGTQEGLMEGIILSLRIVLLFVSSTVFVATTPIQDMLDAVEVVVSKFKQSSSLFFLLSITLNFLPMLIRSAQQIKAAQIARGADVDSSLVKQIRFASSAALPLFVTSFRASHYLADAMEARGFDVNAHRTPFREPHMNTRDWITLAIVIVATLSLHIFEWRITTQ